MMAGASIGHATIQLGERKGAGPKTRRLPALRLTVGLLVAGFVAMPAPVAAQDPPTAPGVPGVQVQLGDQKVSLHIKEPDDGGSPITRYEYRAKVATGSYPTSWTRVPEYTGKVGSTLEIYVAVESLSDGTALANGTQYAFQVRAVNAVGPGSAAEATATPTPNTESTVTVDRESGIVTRRPLAPAPRVPAGVHVSLVGAIQDDDGIDTATDGDDRFTFQWEWIRVRNGSETVIRGAGGRTGLPASNYTLTRADVGSQIKARVRFRDDRYNQEEFVTALFPPNGTILPAATCPAPTYTGGAEQIWSETITIEDIDHTEPAPNRYGVGRFALRTDGFTAGSNAYGIDWIYRATTGAEAGKLIFGLTADLTEMDKNQLTLYVCDEAYPLVNATLQTQAHDYEWPSSDDWSTYIRRTIHLGRDAVAPMPVRARITGTSPTIVITFDEELDVGSKPAASAFTVKVDGAPVSLAPGSTAPISGNGVTLTLEEARNAGSETITLSYAKPGTGNLRDSARNEVAAFDDLRVTRPPRPPRAGPQFTQRRYIFELPEERDGRTEPVLLGSVEATDPGAGSVEYELAEGDGERFWVDPATGAVTYIGPGEDFETGPTQYEFVVRAVSGGGVADAQVEVRVTDVDLGPQPVDDTAETPEDTPVTIPVLDNDDPGENGPLSVAEVSLPAHGSVSVTAGGGVLYTPDADYHGPDRFTYVAEDGAGARAEAAVAVTVVPVDDPPQPVDDTAETPEDTPVTIPVLDNDDPGENGPLSVAEVSAPAHGSASVTAGGGVLYTPDADYHGPDRFTYVAEDGAGARVEAAVAVTVLPVNDPPQPVDDAAETPEDAPVTIAVLENDRDGDGDPLVVLEVSAPAHGSALVTAGGGGVLYTPEPNYHGPDRFSYTIGDGTGLTAGAAVAVTVLPVNDPPVAVGTIPDQALEAGDGSGDLDVAPFFSDLDGDPLSYAAAVSGPAVAAGVSGSILTLTVARPGAATVTVTAEDPGGAMATQVFRVTTTDRRPRAVLEDALAAIGRGHLASARATLGRRMEATGAEETRITLAGRAVPLGVGEAVPLGVGEAAALGRAEVERWLAGMTGATGGRGWTGPGTGAGTEDAFRSAALALPFGAGGRAAALGLGSAFGAGQTEFLLALGSAQAPEGRWTLWGQADVQGFEGEREEAAQYEGSVRTAWVGVDTRLGERWLAGLALSRSSADANWRSGSESGQLSTGGVTSVQPYLRWSNGTTTVWAMAGGGRGTAASDRKTYGLRRESSLALRLGLMEVRRRLATVGGGVQLGLRGDAAWARLSTAAGDEIIEGLRVDVHQVRVGVEASGRVRTAGGTLMEPFGEVHARRDGGSGETGTGLEVAGGFRVARGVFRIQGMGRLLALHSAAGYRERGAAVTVTVGEGSTEPGLALSLSPRWGAETRASGALWEDELLRRRADAARADERALDARVDYGVELPGGGLLTPFGVYSRSQYGSRMEAGLLLRALGPFGLEVSGERHPLLDLGGDEYRLSALGRVTLGRPRPR